MAQYTCLALILNHLKYCSIHPFCIFLFNFCFAFLLSCRCHAQMYKNDQQPRNCLPSNVWIKDALGGKIYQISGICGETPCKWVFRCRIFFSGRYECVVCSMIMLARELIVHTPANFDNFYFITSFVWVNWAHSAHKFDGEREKAIGKNISIWTDLVRFELLNE